MQGRLKVRANFKKSHWLEIVEILSVFGSIGGSLASVVSQQVAFASIPLSLSVTLNLVNRRLLLDSIDNSNQTTVAQIIQENVETQAKVGTLIQQLAEVQQLTTELGQGISDLEDDIQLLPKEQTEIPVTQIIQENVETRSKLGMLTEQLAELQQLTTNSAQGTSSLQEYTQLLRKDQTEVANVVGYLREIETYSQAIRINPNNANAYYNRGLSYQRLGNQEGAIGDYTESIRINPSYAEAYHTRGLARADLGDKKGAVEDLRAAAKFFFDQGDIAKYQTARELSKNFHEHSSQPKTEVPEKVALESLFS